MDLINPAIANHHIRTAYFAHEIASAANITGKELSDLVTAAMLHDIGAFSLDGKLAALNFEMANPHTHADAGWKLLKDFAPFENVARIIQHHHHEWNSSPSDNDSIPRTCGILYLADRIAVSINNDEHILLQAPWIISTVTYLRGTKFSPDYVDAFLSIAGKEAFWLSAADIENNPRISSIIADDTGVALNAEMLLQLSKIFSRIIDFRSPFTATHSSGVAAVAQSLFRFMGKDENEILKILIAGYLHDLGKLSVPPEILEKQETLTKAEMAIIRSHTYHTHGVLSGIKGFSDIELWACAHHETLDGKGYPFHLTADEIPAGARVIAVADIFTALMENRPYRKGMSGAAALEIIRTMSTNGKLDCEITALLLEHFDDINELRMESQKTSENEYHQFRSE